MNLRSATIDDLDLLKYWDTQQHVIDSDPDDDWDWENELTKFPPWREQLFAEVDGRPIGFIQIIDAAREETHYWGDVGDHLKAIDIWIGAEADLGKGYGTEMMHLAIEHCFSDEKTTSILIDPLESNKKAIRFYEKLGFQLVERRQFGSSTCLVYELTREHWDGRHS